MKADDLKQFVLRGDRGGLCAALAPLKESERQALADDALRIFEVVDKYGFEAENIDLKTINDSEAAKLVGAMKQQEYEDWRIPRYTAGLGVLGLCDRKTLEGPRGSWFHDDMRDMPHRVLQVLNDRRPKWLASWIAKDVRKEYPTTSWYVERGLIRSGALPPNLQDDYLERMAEHVGSYVDVKFDFGDIKEDLPSYAGSIEELLLADRDLLENEIWRLFEVQTKAFVYDWQWRETLTEMSEKGTMARDRLLAACLDAMALPFRKQELSGYVKLHDELEPTLDERAQLVDKYFVLLGNEIPQIVGSGMKAMELLAKAKRLDASEFFGACPDIYRLANKAQPRKAIKLTNKLVKDDPSLASAAASATIHGIGNEAADVQGDALELLESLAEAIDDDARAGLQVWSEHVAATLRSRFDALLESGGAADDDESSHAAETASSADCGEYQARIDALTDQLREPTGVNAALRRLQEQSEPCVAKIPPGSVPRRDPASTVQPLQSLDELIDAVAALVEGVDDVMDIERIMDGIARYHAERPDDFEKRVKPLRKRIEARSEPYSYTVFDRGAEVGLSQLVRRWLEMPEVHRDWGRWRDLDGQVFRDRTRELIWRIEGPQRDRSTQPLLSLPTHRDGWLDPVVLVERLEGYKLSDAEYLVPDHDFAQALLRLTPDGRDEALEMLPESGKRTTMRQLRFALGGETRIDKPTAGFATSETALAAVHCRSLVDDLADLEAPFPLPVARLDENGQAEFSGPLAEDIAMPGSLLSKAHSLVEIPDAWGGSSAADWLFDWQNLVWPGNRGPLCLYASLGSAPACYLKALLDPDANWGEEACRLAAWAMGASQPLPKGMITDALIEAMGSVYVDPERLGRRLAAILPHLKLNRVAAVLDQTSRISPLHHWFVFKTLEAVLSRLSEVPRDLHHLLTVMLESATVTGNTLSEAASEGLHTIKGATKTAKLARQLLA